MGRKIPGKKHHGTKDPIKQQRARFESIKNKINCPPADVNDQPVPGNLQRIAQWKELDNQDFSKRKMKRLNMYKSWVLGIPPVEQGKGKKLKRTVVNKSEKLYNQAKAVDEELVDEYNSLQCGSNESKQSSKRANTKGNMQQILLNAGGKRKNLKANNISQSTSRKEKKLRLAAKRKARLQKVKEREEDDDHLVDIVEFGEVAHAPPTLTLPTKKQKQVDKPKPGNRGLILKEMLQNVGQSSVSQRLKISDEERNRLEQNRLQVVQNYRKLKASKRKHQDA